MRLLPKMGRHRGTDWHSSSESLPVLPLVKTYRQLRRLNGTDWPDFQARRLGQIYQKAKTGRADGCSSMPWLRQNFDQPDCGG